MTGGLSTNATRALDILLILGEVGPEGLSLAQIAGRVGHAKSTVHRSLAALLEKGFVEGTGRYGHYRLGPAILMLARRHERLEPQIERIRPGMTEFARRTGFTVYLIMQAGVDAVCAEMVSRSTRQVFTMGIGARVPMGIAAGSLALLSMLPEDVAARIIRTNAERYTRYPALRDVNADIISADVSEARRRGYAVNMGNYLPGQGGLGLPYPARIDGGTDFAVSFNAPLEMMTADWIAGMMDDLAECLDRDSADPAIP